jgi:5-methyltetrahydrofolate--homocysteine methyltransferase
MTDLTHWRGFDLAPRRAKIERTFRLAEVTSPEDVPIVINVPCYFAFGSTRMPADYFANPAAMLEYQVRGCETHLATVDDDYVPFFMPWFGTGVLASGFGCEIKIQSGPGNDPAVAGPCVTSPREAARLRMPDPYRDGWMPRVLDTIDYVRAHSDLPPALTDMQGPLDTLGLMCGQTQLYQWMYREPRMIHELFQLVTEAFIEWGKVQKQHIGEPLDRSNGLQGVWAPVGLGIHEADDELVLLDPGLYREFVVPYVSRIFEAFGGGSVHFCGNGVHQIENLRQIKNLRVVHNAPMGNFKAFATLKQHLGDRVVLHVLDMSPLKVEDYYTHLLAAIDDFRGMILVPMIMDSLGMDNSGGYAPVDWDPFTIANRIVAVTRECVRRKLAGELFVIETEPESFQVARPSAALAPTRPPLTTAQEAALKAVQDCLIKFDGEVLKEMVHAALQAGIVPFDVVTLGMAEGMVEVGRRYEVGQFFLPELVMAAATMNEGMIVLQPLLHGAGGGQGKGTIVIGTVRGDVHDIGKNLVKTLLQAAGFTVHDIGVDQPADHFVRKVRETNADIVALSALLTTTMPEMARVLDNLQSAGLRDQVRVMVGGAPISREFADRIGAEGYAPDAVKAVRETERLMTLSRT